MKNLIVILSLSLLTVTSFVNANATETSTEGTLKWYTTLSEVHKISQETGKPVFGFFTGSDWCGWCHKLQREVFAKPLFIEWANKNVVLLELDFPRKTVQAEDLKKQNQALQQIFQVTGYPTIWIFNTGIDAATSNYTVSAIGKLGYPSGAVVGQEEVKFLADADAVLAKVPAKAN